MAIRKLPRRHTHTQIDMYITTIFTNMRPILPFAMFPFPDKFEFKGIFQGLTGAISETYDAGSRVLDKMKGQRSFCLQKDLKKETLRLYAPDRRFMCFGVIALNLNLNQDK